MHDTRFAGLKTYNGTRMHKQCLVVVVEVNGNRATVVELKCSWDCAIVKLENWHASPECGNTVGY